MKTDIQHALWIAMTSFFILSAVIKPSEEKCAGRWAIHACWGGNGKRSDPSMDMAPGPDILRQLLLRTSPVFPRSNDQMPVESLPPNFNGVSSSEDEEDFNVAVNDALAAPPSPSATASRLAALLRTLRALQRENDGLP